MNFIPLSLVMSNEYRYNGILYQMISRFIFKIINNYDYYYVGISIILVPNEPINFTVTSKYLYFSNIHITLNWIQPQSSDEDGVVDYFILYIQSTLGTDVISNIQSSNWSLILYYQIKYKIIINAVNCVGKSPEKTIFCK